MDGVEDAIETWDTDIRLFREAGGQPPPDHQRRSTLIQMLPIDISAYVTMHMDLPAHSSYNTLNKFTLSTSEL